MNRYQDNISPEPNICINLNECYKTPNLNQQYSTIYNINQLYPTPPSDNEISPSSDNVIKQSADNLSTPNIGYYDQNSFNNDSHDNSTYRSCQDDRSMSQDVNTMSQAGSRFKRRSRTTYTKAQLDALEATFQKTHYPEIRVVDDLSSMLNLSTERISIWFQNRRARFKKARKLETQENKTSLENINQYTNYPITNTYPNINLYSNSKTDAFPINRNLFNSLTPTVEKQNLNSALANSQFNSFNYYNQISNISSNNLPNGLPFYNTQIPSNTSGYYQPSYPMIYPSYQSSGLQ